MGVSEIKQGINDSSLWFVIEIPYQLFCIKFMLLQ